MHTELSYLQDTYQYEQSAKIIDISEDEHGAYLVVNQSIFYPQGGGQPSDKGSLTTSEGHSFEVLAARLKEGQVRLYSPGAQSMQIGQQVMQHIDAQLRIAHARLHTAGHLIHAVMTEVDSSLHAKKGHHFPESPYVEFAGDPSMLIEMLMDRLNSALQTAIADALPIHSEFVTLEELKARGALIPEALPEGKPLRMVQIAHYQPVPCGGTHVASTAELGSLRVHKIKSKGGVTKVSYE